MLIICLQLWEEVKKLQMGSSHRGLFLGAFLSLPVENRVIFLKGLYLS